VPDRTSRYATVAIASVDIPDGLGAQRSERYLRRRFPPQPATLLTSAEHVVRGGDRLDVLAATYLGDPTQFWRICDANPVIHPDALTAADRIGSPLRIPVPQP
jgi:nucleoid-associated protein YgaU